MTEHDNELILWCSLILSEKSTARDAAKLNAVWQYAKRAGVTTLLIKVASMHELPDALNHQNIRMFLQVAEMFGLKVIWGRNLWMKWPKPGDVADISTMENPAYYASAIANVRAEARSIGAASFLDGEPYGDTAVKLNYKGRDMSLDELWRIKLAVHDATAMAGLVDYSYPVDSGSHNRYQWCMGHLGEHWLNATTYL